MTKEGAGKINKGDGITRPAAGAGTLAGSVLMLVSVVLLFMANAKVPFMMDDLWYSTNISDGSPLTGLTDIFESQKWHYYSWGGRVFTHGFLQLVLMSGELCADVINVVCTVIIAAEMYCLALLSSGDDHGKEPVIFFIMYGMLISFCPDFKMSMLWQAGCANYVYSTVWILAFYLVYMRTLAGKKDLPLSYLFMIPLSLMTGWSTENMGPAAFITSLVITVYVIKTKGVPLKTKIMLAEGTVFSFAGSLMCILAPGNFVRKDVGNAEISEGVFERTLQMLKGAGEYLFPALLILAACYVLFRTSKEGRTDIRILIMLFAAVMSYGAFALSPHYPARAAFGTCVLLEICCGGMLSSLTKEKEEKLKAVSLLFLASSVFVIFKVIAE